MGDQQQARSNPFSDALYFYLSGNYRCGFACMRDLDDAQLLRLALLSEDGLVELMALDKRQCVGLHDLARVIREDAASEQRRRLSSAYLV